MPETYNPDDYVALSQLEELVTGNTPYLKLDHNDHEYSARSVFEVGEDSPTLFGLLGGVLPARRVVLSRNVDPGDSSMNRYGLSIYATSVREDSAVYSVRHYLNRGPDGIEVEGLERASVEDRCQSIGIVVGRVALGLLPGGDITRV